METPYLNSTRTEKDFEKAVETLVENDPEAPWTFVCDGQTPISLNPRSGSWQKPAGRTRRLVKKGKALFLRVWAAAGSFSMTPPIGYGSYIPEAQFMDEPD